LAERVFAEVRFWPPIRPLRTEACRIEIIEILYTKGLRMQIGSKHGFTVGSVSLISKGLGNSGRILDWK
jgi:hypothetical protein